MHERIEIFVARNLDGQAYQFNSGPVFDGQAWTGGGKLELDEDLDHALASIQPGTVAPVTLEVWPHGHGPEASLLYLTRLSGLHDDVWIKVDQGKQVFEPEMQQN